MGSTIDVFSEQYYDLAIDDTGTGTNPDQAVTLGADVTSYAFNFQASHTYNITLKARTDCYGASGPSQTLSVAVSTNVSATQTAQAALTLTAQAVTVTPTATPSRTATATATATRTSTPTATATGAGTQLTRQVAASSDDVNEDGATFDSAGTTVWLGTGGSTSASYTGFRFTNIAIPQGATITSAKLQVYVPATTWTQIDFSYAAENVANSATFSSSSKPSQRTLTTQTVSHSSNTQWTASTWYDLDEIKTVVQPVISRADWASGNALSIILKGTGSAYGRKIVTGYDGTPANAVRLVITYTTGGPTPTATATATATHTNTPTSTATGTVASCAVLDNFNRANGAIGSGWSGNTATTQYQITSNQLDVVHSGDAGPIFWNATSFGTTQQACVKLAAIDANADEVALVLKSQSSTGYSSGAMEVLFYPPGSVVRVFTYDSGNGWVQRGSDIGTTFAAGDTLRVVARSNGQVEVYKNATLLGTRDASAWTYSGQGGYIGLWSILGPNTMFDDFGGGTYSGRSAADVRAMGAPKTLHKVMPCGHRPNALSRPTSTVSSPTSGWVSRLYYYAGSKPVAFREIQTGGGHAIHYVHTDHLSGTNITTNSSGAREQEPVRYTPFGNIRTGKQADLHTGRGFTGQYNDASLGLMYFNARYYSPYLNRWLQPDTIVPSAGNPQALNRFSYVLNSPLNLVDPSGHCSENRDRDSECWDSYNKAVTELGLGYSPAGLSGWTLAQLSDLLGWLARGIRFSFDPANPGYPWQARDIGIVLKGLNAAAGYLGDLTDKLLGIGEFGTLSFLNSGVDHTQYVAKQNTVLMRNNFVLQEVVHELGHDVDWHLRPSGSPWGWSATSEAWMSATGWSQPAGCLTSWCISTTGRKGAVSSYALTDPGEDFAETFVWEVLGPSGFTSTLQNPYSTRRYWPNTDRDTALTTAIFGP